ncbi:MAG: futalosine hydrolase [Phycisphaeraceae bacterium]|nr:futalosine hydrolase [Phycisphaerales bacterium]MCB9859906.1 futalosine hydrolase [Phycisphaeraceae bacterium]
MQHQDTQPDAIVSSQLPSRHGLVVVAAPKEWEAVAPVLGFNPDSPKIGEVSRSTSGSHQWDLMRCGVGKTQAGLLTFRALNEYGHARVISLGIAGALSGPDGAPSLDIGTVVVSSQCLFADEGVQAPDRFIPMSELGFGIEDPHNKQSPPHTIEAAPHDPNASKALLDQLVERSAQPDSMISCAVSAPVATVSICAGTDELASTRAQYSGAACEAMEGAAVVLAAHWLRVSAVEVRVISNTTGDRNHQRWDLNLAMDVLAEVASVVASLPQ